MITLLQKAVLHILNAETGVSVYSKEELDISDNSINAYITGCIDKNFNITNLRQGSFMSNSGCKAHTLNYVNHRETFLSLSKYIAERMYDGIHESDKPMATDIIVCEFTSKSTNYIGIMKLDNKAGYIHRIINTPNEMNTLENNSAMLPSGGQTIKECAFIELNEKLPIQYMSKNYLISGEKVDLLSEVVLECNCDYVSDKETNTEFTKSIKKSALNALDSTVKLKSFILDKIEQQTDSQDTPVYTAEEMAENIFSSVSEQQAFIENGIKAGVISNGNDELEIGEYTIKKTNEKVKIVTDTGVEIKFPAYMYDSGEFKITQQSDGSLTITISNINETVVK